jgi:hypothetical protein
LSSNLPFTTTAEPHTGAAGRSKPAQLPFAKKKDTREKNRGLFLISSIFVDGDVVSG